MTMMHNDDGDHDEVRYARVAILKLGTLRFGPPDVAIQGELEQIVDLSRLNALRDRLFTARSWIDLFGPRPPESQ